MPITRQNALNLKSVLLRDDFLVVRVAYHGKFRKREITNARQFKVIK